MLKQSKPKSGNTVKTQKLLNGQNAKVVNPKFYLNKTHKKIKMSKRKKYKTKLLKQFKLKNFNMVKTKQKC